MHAIRDIHSQYLGSFLSKSYSYEEQLDPLYSSLMLLIHLGLSSVELYTNVESYNHTIITGGKEHPDLLV